MRAELGVVSCALLVVVVALLGSRPVAGAGPAPCGAPSLDQAHIDLLERLGDVRFVHDGERLLVRTEGDGEERLLDARAWVHALDDAQRAQGEPTHSTGAFVYARNLFLIQRRSRESTAAFDADAAQPLPTRAT